MDLAISSLPFLTKGLAVTLQVSAVVVLVSLLVGVVLGVALVYGPLPLRLLIRAYSDIIRGIPVLVLIFAVYYGLPALKVNLSNLVAATAALAGASPGTPRGRKAAGRGTARRSATARATSTTSSLTATTRRTSRRPSTRSTPSTCRGAPTSGRCGST